MGEEIEKKEKRLRIVHKSSQGSIESSPDECKTPSPGGPIPIPYPNIAKSSDTSKGAKTVKINGKQVMIKGSSYEKGTGDEPSVGEEVSPTEVETDYQAIVEEADTLEGEYGDVPVRGPFEKDRKSMTELVCGETKTGKDRLLLKYKWWILGFPLLVVSLVIWNAVSHVPYVPVPLE